MKKHMDRLRRGLSPLLLLPLLWAAATLPFPSSAHAGAWSPEPGHGYAKLWAKHLLGFGYHDGKGQTLDYGSYHEVFLNAYGEVGLAKNLAATLHFPFFKFFTLEEVRNQAGETSSDMQRHLTVGDPSLGLRYQVLSIGRFASSFELAVRAPLATNKKVQPFFAKDGERLGDLRIGAGVWDVEPTLSFGYGWNRVYTQATVGYTARTGNYDPAMRWTAEVGGNLRNKWDGRARATGYHSLLIGSASRDETPSGIGNGITYMGFALEVEYQFIPNWWLGYALEGGMGILRRQTGGPVNNIYAATKF